MTYSAQPGTENSQTGEALPTFKSGEFLLDHIQKTIAFYDTNIDDPHGGFFQNFADDGTVVDAHARHLVSSTRFVFNYSRAYLQFGREKDFARVKSGVAFLQQHHFNPDTQGYFWRIDMHDGKATIIDDTNHCYGVAFVLLAYSWAYRAGVTEAKDAIENTWHLLESRYWDDAAGLYRDEFNGDFSRCDAYRGQNANMHTCEALIAAFHATQDNKFLDRALLLADHMVNRQASLAGGLIWEHYQENWQIDWEYNKDDPQHLFRPWGFQPGHQIEWAKLLMMLHTLRPTPWLVERATALFDESIAIAWDKQHGGIVYGFDPQKQICDAHKYFWVQAESFACAALLALETQDEKYWKWYNDIWAYAWTHLVDHEFGAWFHILSQDNQKLETTKSPMGKTDYHTLGASFDVFDHLQTFEQR